MAAADIQCSFCSKRADQVSKMIAGPGSYICNECVGLCNEILASVAGSEDAGESGGSGDTAESGESGESTVDEPRLPSWSSLTDEEVLERLPTIAASAAQVEGTLRQWIGEARRRGASWAQVGAVLEMSRQSAWERFARE